MIRWLHRALTIWLMLRHYGNGPLRTAWKTLGMALGFGAYFAPQRWAWGPWLAPWRIMALERRQQAWFDGKVAQARRLRRYAIAGDLLLHLGHTAYRVVDSEIPADAELVGAEWMPDRQQLVLYVCHPSWPEIADNTEPPWRTPTSYRAVCPPADYERQPSMN